MTYISPEGIALPSPTCTLPTPEDVAAAAAEMHAQLFESAPRPRISPPYILISGTSAAEWAVESGAVELTIRQDGYFTDPVNRDSLATSPFGLEMRTKQEETARGCNLTVLHEADSLAFYNNSMTTWPAHVRMSDEQIEAGKEVLRRFLAGEVEAQQETTSRQFHLALEMGTLSAKETTIQAGQRHTRIEHILEVSPRSENAFLLNAQWASGGETAIRYRDKRDYYGPFGVATGKLLRFPVATGTLKLLPPRLGDPGRSPARFAADQEIDRTREVLTSSRLREVQLCVEEALGQLAKYHESFREMMDKT